MKEEGQRVLRSASGFGDKVNLDYAKAPAVAKNEENVLGLLILFENHRKKIFEEGLLTSEDFYTELNRRIFDYIKKCYKAGVSVDFDESFSPEEVGRITQMKLSRMRLAENGDDVLVETVDSLKRSLLRKNAEQTVTMEALRSLIDSKRSSNE